MNETRRRVNQAAMQLFAEQGFAATGIRELAERAGVRSASLYHYMGTKEELLSRLMIRGAERVLRLGRDVAAGTDDPLVQLVSLVHAHVSLHIRRQLETRVLDMELRALGRKDYKKVVELRDQYEQVWAEVIAAGVAAGEFALANEKLTRLALLEMCNGVGLWFSPRGSLTARDVADGLADIALGAVRATRKGRPVRAADLTVVDHDSIDKLVKLAFADLLD